MNWDDGDGPFFNPQPAVTSVPLPSGKPVVVIDDVLLDPDGLVEWARARPFHAPDFPYPGLIVDGPKALSERFLDFFAQHARGRLGARRTREHDVRLSMVSTPPSELDPRQWQCHRDRVTTDPSVLFVGSVLYLFRDPALGGTSFYVPRQSPGATDRIVADSQMLTAEEFSTRY
ncbi:MAG TPA: DUF6445 family protein, partial [Burkholderiaceae bacterium]